MMIFPALLHNMWNSYFHRSEAGFCVFFVQGVSNGCVMGT